MTSRELKYFNLAKNACSFSDFPRVKIGCIAVYKNKVLSVGYNSQKTHPLQEYYNHFRNFYPNTGGKFINHSLHAETYCLLQIKDMDIDFGKVELFIFRTRKDRETGMSRPCDGCMRLIKDIGIKVIYYTTDNGLCKDNNGLCMEDIF